MPHWMAPFSMKDLWIGSSVPPPSPLNRHYFASLRGNGQDQARVDRLAIEQNGAGTTVAGAAAFLYASQAELIAQRVDQPCSVLDGH